MSVGIGGNQWWSSTDSISSRKQSYTPSREQQLLNRLYLGNMDAIMWAGQGDYAMPEGSMASYLPGGKRYDASLFTPGASEQPFIQSIQDVAMRGGNELGSRDSLMGAMRSYFDTIVAPEMANNAAVSGYGGRGSAGYLEGITRYLGQAAPQVEQMYRQGLMSAPAMYGQGLQAAGMQRQGRLSDYMNQLNTVSTALLGIPVTNWGQTRGYDVGQTWGRGGSASVSASGGMGMGGG